METNRAAGTKTMIKIHNEFSNVFTDIGCFKGTFSLKINFNSILYQGPPRHITFSL